MRNTQAVSNDRKKRTERRHQQPRADRANEEKNRRRATGGGQQPDELGITQGQNGELGNTVTPRNAQHYGDVAH
jgi:hypothetical protein